MDPLRRLALMAACLLPVGWIGVAHDARATVRLGGVQTGEIALSGSGTVTVPVTLVDPTRSFVLVQARSDNNTPGPAEVRAHLSSGSTLELTRNTVQSTTTIVRWWLVEYQAGVSVQRGEIAQAATSVDVPIAAVVVSSAFVLWSKSVAATDIVWNGDDPSIGALTSPTNLQFRRSISSSGHEIAWQVVEITDPGDALVQAGLSSLVGSELTKDVMLPTPVSLGASFALVGFTSIGDSTSIGARLLRAELLDSTTLRLTRELTAPGEDMPEIAWQVVELLDGSTVQHGVTSLATGVATATEPLSPSHPDRTIALSTVQPGAGQGPGSTPYAGDDIVGVASATLQLSAGALTVTRSATQGPATIAWSVIELGKRRVMIID